MYEAMLYEPGHDRQTVQVHASPEGLQLESSQGPQTWAWHQLKLEWGGAETRMVAIKVGDRCLYVSSRELLESMLPRLDSLQQSALRRMIKKRGASVWKGLLAFMAASLIVILLCVWGSIWLLARGRDAAIAQIPVSWEEQVGKQVYTEMTEDTPVCKSPMITQGIKVLEDRLEKPIPQKPYDLRFQVIKSEQINAFALPGGYIALNAALVAKAPSPEALLGVMAHESQHVLQRHGLKGMVNKLGLTLVLPLIFGDMGTILGTLATVGAGLLNLGFSRGQESEADRLGLTLLQGARIDPKGMEAFFSWMSAEEAKQGVEIPEFISTHPLSHDRLEQIRKEISELPAYTPVPVKLDWKAFQAAAAECIK